MNATPADANKLSRRELISRLAALTTGSLLAGCTPLRILLADPRGFARKRARLEPVLQAFVGAVIPGVQEDDPVVARAHLDPAYPFARYAGYFVKDLCRRAGKLFGTAEVHRLSLAERQAVIRDGLAAGRTTSRLYQGAIFLAQIAIYSGIYDDRPGSSLIDFEGPYRLRDPRELTHPNAGAFLPRALTVNGNPV